jgi:hypothetical protein
MVSQIVNEFLEAKPVDTANTSKQPVPRLLITPTLTITGFEAVV